MEATSLADLINGIVSDIDQDVVGRRMTKVDTIGDGQTNELHALSVVRTSVQAHMLTSNHTQPLNAPLSRSLHSGGMAA